MLSFHIAPGFIGSLHLATCGIQASIPCHNGSVSRIFLPLRMPEVAIRTRGNEHYCANNRAFDVLQC